jgi:hypothetical protein
MLLEKHKKVFLHQRPIFCGLTPAQALDPLLFIENFNAIFVGAMLTSIIYITLASEGWWFRSGCIQYFLTYCLERKSKNNKAGVCDQETGNNMLDEIEYKVVLPLV